MEFNTSFTLTRVWHVSPEVDRAWHEASLEKLLPAESRCSITLEEVSERDVRFGSLRFSFTLDAGSRQEARDLADELVMQILSLSPRISCGIPSWQR